MMDKNFLASKTIQGVLVTLLGILLPKFGLDLGGEEVSQVAEALLILAGIGWTVYGRAKASGGLTVGKAKNAAPLVLVLVMLPGLLGGCAATTSGTRGTGEGLTALETAMTAGDKMSDLWLEVSGLYDSLMLTASAEVQSKLKSEIAPVINEAQEALVAYNGLVIAWAETGDGATEAERLALVSQITACCTKALSKILAYTMEDKS
jgi:hypothetical protein